MYSVIEQITRRLNSLFPDDGQELPGPFVNDRNLFEVRDLLATYWHHIPDSIKDRARRIDDNFYRRREPVYLLTDVQPGID